MTEPNNTQPKPEKRDDEPNHPRTLAELIQKLRDDGKLPKGTEEKP